MGKFLQGLVENERVMLRPHVVMLIHGVGASRMYSIRGKAKVYLKEPGSMHYCYNTMALWEWPPFCQSESIHPTLTGARHCLGTLESPAERQSLYSVWKPDLK